MFHQARGITDASHVAYMRFDLEIFEIDSTENNPCICRCWNQLDVGLDGSVQSRPIDRDRPLNCALVRHETYLIAFERPFALQLTALIS